jgi:hypothetical protein
MASLVYVHLILRSSALICEIRCTPSLITAFREAFILKWLVCAINVASTYQENIKVRATPHPIRVMAQPNRMMP